MDANKKLEYNPLEHRKLAHPTSTIGSFFHLLKSSLGTGLLAMPMAFNSTGIIPGVIGTVLVAAIATHCIHILSDLILGFNGSLTFALFGVAPTAGCVAYMMDFRYFWFSGKYRITLNEVIYTSGWHL